MWEKAPEKDLTAVAGMLRRALRTFLGLVFHGSDPLASVKNPNPWQAVDKMTPSWQSLQRPQNDQDLKRIQTAPVSLATKRHVCAAKNQNSHTWLLHAKLNPTCCVVQIN